VALARRSVQGMPCPALGLTGRLPQPQVARDEGRNDDLTFDPARKEVDHLDVNVRHVEVTRDTWLNPSRSNVC
jgi:hypothetical protein